MAAVLRAGGTVVLPTDTVVGLAALPGDADAMARLALLKGRSPDQACAVLVADAAQGLALFEAPSPAMRAWAGACWPGPLTIVGRRSAAAHGFELGGDPSTIGVRCPDDATIRAVAALVGPIAATSANRHGEETPAEPGAAAEALLGSVDLVVDDPPPAAGGVASTVVDASVSPWVVRREGSIAAATLAVLASEAGAA